MLMHLASNSEGQNAEKPMPKAMQILIRFQCDFGPTCPQRYRLGPPQGLIRGSPPKYTVKAPKYTVKASKSHQYPPNWVPNRFQNTAKTTLQSSLVPMKPNFYGLKPYSSRTQAIWAAQMDPKFVETPATFGQIDPG